MIYWATKAAEESSVDKVYVSTDSEEIKSTVEAFGFPKVSVIGRSKQTATDTATTESAMLEFCTNFMFDNIILIQATSPLITAQDIDGGIEMFKNPNVDSVLSVVLQKRFIWLAQSDGAVEAANYDPLKRPMRQSMDGYFVENGAFYITSRDALITSRCRISGRIFAYKMDERSYYELDEPLDWAIVDSIGEYH